MKSERAHLAPPLVTLHCYDDRCALRQGKGCSMNDDARLADRLLDKIAKGLLPRDRPEKIGTGHGAGDPCGACEEPIQAAQLEYRIGANTQITHRFHLRCYGLWSAEVYRRRGKLYRPRLSGH
jgi:hypothetical protein